MFQWILKKIRKDNKGFTLIELIVVIAILGILAGIAVPKLSESRVKAAQTAHNANVRTLEGAATMFMAENDLPTGNDPVVTWSPDGGTKASTITDQDLKLDVNKWALYVQEWPEIPKGLKDGDTAITGSYTVTINSDGTIVVLPEAIELNKEDTSDAGGDASRYQE